MPTTRLTIPVDVTPVAENTAVSSVPLPDGWIISIQPVVLAGSDPRGGDYYCRVSVLRGRTLVAIEAQTNLWCGYLRSLHMPASLPGIRCYEPQTLVVDISSATDIPANSVIRVNVTIETDLAVTPCGSFIFSEPPVTGPGTLRFISLAQPAAGSDYATQSVPANTTWRVRGWYGQLTASAGVANRRPRLFVRDDTTNQVVFLAGASVAQTATQVMDYYAGNTGGNVEVSGVYSGLSLSDGPGIVLPSDVRFITSGLDGSDQWSAGFLAVEEWATP